jgi:hypothetical protein
MKTGNIVSGNNSIIFGKNGYCDTDHTVVIADGFSQIEINKYGNITSNGQEIDNEEIIEILKGSMMFVLSTSNHIEIYERYVRNKKLKRILNKKEK